MNNKQTPLNVGQRVRINEEDAPAWHLGKMAIVENVTVSEEGEPIADVRIDRSNELITIPQKFLKPIALIPSSLFASNLSLPWDPEPNIRINKYIDNNWIAAYVLENLLFYDKVIIPTSDFSIIVPLLHWFGPPLFKDLLAAESISFVHTTGGLAYSGNGAGLMMFEIHPSKEKEEKEPWWVKVHRCIPKEAVTLQINNRLTGLNESVIENLAKLVELTTVETALPQFQEKVANETYRDIQGSPVLNQYLFNKNPQIYKMELNRLPGIEPNQMRVFYSLPRPAVAGDSIDTTLRIAMLNLEAYMSEEAGARDMVTDRSYNLLINAKVQRYTGGRLAQQSFDQLMKIEGIPDLVSMIMSGGISLPDLWNYRNTNVATEFRQWFEQIGPTNPNILVTEYVKSLKSGNFLSNTKVKIIRFIIPQIVGAALIPVTPGISFIASMGISAVDCFLLDKIRLGFKPRYFIDELRNIFSR